MALLIRLALGGLVGGGVGVHQECISLDLFSAWTPGMWPTHPTLRVRTSICPRSRHEVRVAPEVLEWLQHTSGSALYYYYLIILYVKQETFLPLACSSIFQVIQALNILCRNTLGGNTCIYVYIKALFKESKNCFLYSSYINLFSDQPFAPTCKPTFLSRFCLLMSMVK